MINKFGLYKNVVPRHQIWGLKSHKWLDDQTQGWWLPFFKDGEIYLVDTYHINNYKRNEFIEKLIEDNENNKDNNWLVDRANWEYYYGGSVKITSITKDCFKEVCDLRYFKPTSDDPNDYEEEDIVRNVQLWFEHGYPNGVTLKRKDASKSINKQALNKMYQTLDDICISWIRSYDVEELEKYLKSSKVDEKIKLKLEAALRYINKVLECNKRIEEARSIYDKEINKIDGQ